MRYKFSRDDDGHWYLIPEDMESTFNEMLLNGEDDYWAEFNNTFEEYRSDSPTNYTFTDPSF